MVEEPTNNYELPRMDLGKSVNVYLFPVQASSLDLKQGLKLLSKRHICTFVDKIAELGFYPQNIISWFVD